MERQFKRMNTDSGERRLSRCLNFAMVLLGVLLALLIRHGLRGFESWDYTAYTKVWYKTIRAQGFGAFSSEFADYTPAYLYCLYVVSLVFPRISVVLATKAPALAADFVCAFLVFLLVRRKCGKDSPFPLLSFFAVIFAPTVLLNSAFWGQCDSIFTAALLACLYFVTVRRPAYACIAFGVAFAFKLQAIFFGPLLAVLVLRRIISWKHLALIPAVYLVMIIPSCLAGRPMFDLMTIYADQVDQLQALMIDAPNMYAWLPSYLYNIFYPAGLAFGAAMALLYVECVWRSRVDMDPEIFVLLALVSVTLMPFCLPKMHERYFYAADVISILYAFYYPRRFYVPILIGASSFFAYQHFLFGSEFVTIPIPVLAFVMLFVLVIIVRHMIVSLYPNGQSSTARQRG